MRAFLLFALATLLAHPAAAKPSAEAKIAAETVRQDVFPVTTARFPHGVDAIPQVEVANYDGFRPVRMDIYRPHRSATPRPAVLWIHGGGWSRGDSRTSGAYADWPKVLASLAARGFVVASLNYRLSGEARLPAQVQDVKAAIRHLRLHARDLGVDASRIYLWGGSAGAHLAALAATTCGATEFAPPPSTGRLERSEIAALRRVPAPPAGLDCVQGAALWYGLFDLEASPKVNVAGVLGCAPESCIATARAASPLHRVGPDAPPMLLIHGDADRTAPPEQSAAMAEALHAAGVRAELVMIPGADHGWLGATPEATRDASLLALRRTFAFFDSLAAGR